MLQKISERPKTKLSYKKKIEKFYNFIFILIIKYNFNRDFCLALKYQRTFFSPICIYAFRANQNSFKLGKKGYIALVQKYITYFM